MTSGKIKALSELNRRRRQSLIWFWRPQWHWFGWKTLIPFSYGHDEYARRTLLLGWTITGRVIFPLWDCGDEACHYWAIEEMKKGVNDD